MPDDYRIHIWRHGEPWIIIDQGSKAVLAMMQEVERLKSIELKHQEFEKVLEMDQKIKRKSLDEINSELNNLFVRAELA